MSALMHLEVEMFAVVAVVVIVSQNKQVPTVRVLEPAS